MTRARVGILLFVALTGTPAIGQEPCPSCPWSQLPPCTLLPNGTTDPHLENSLSVYDGHGLPEGVLSLTYDDGPSRPSANATLELAAFLRSWGIRATFFVNTGPATGLAPFPPWGPPCHNNLSWGQGADPDLPDLSALGKMEQLGHRIANHTHNHVNVGVLGEWNQLSQIAPQVCKAQEILNPYVPDGIFLFRPAYGGWSSNAATNLRSVESLNKVYGPVHWTIPSDDHISANAGISASAYATQFLGRAEMNNLATKGTILFHDKLLSKGQPSCSGGSACCSFTCPPNYQGTWALDAAKSIIPALKNRGFLILPLEADPAFPGGMLFGAKSPWSSTYFGDSGGWGAILGYYGTFRGGDVNGDGKMDLCARGCCSVVCSLSQGNGFAPATDWQGMFSNANGWVPPERSATIQLGDVNNDGKDDLCALDSDGVGSDGVICTLSNGSSFGSPQLWLPIGSLPSVITTDPGYYRTFRLAKVIGGNKGEDLCFRGPLGLMCAKNLGGSFAAPTNWSSTFADASGWLPLYYGGTMQLADINGDGVDDACARGASGIYCGLSNGVDSFNPVEVWSIGANFSNSDFLPADFSTRYTTTFRLADIDGDSRADACIRSAAGFLCAQSMGDSFDIYRVWQKKDFRDDQGWKPDQYAATVMLGDATGDGRADVCMRGPDGMVCAPSGWCTGCTEYTGTLAGAGAVQIEPNGTYYSAPAGLHVAAMAGPTGTDFSLELEKWNGVSWTRVVASPGPTSPERITYQGTAGDYRWTIQSQSGSGSYTFWLKEPD